MFLLASHYLRGAIVIDIAGAEKGLGVVRTVGCKLLQVVVQLLGDVLEIDHLLNVERGLCLLWQDVLVNILLETAAELRNVLNRQRQADGVSVASEIVKDVTAGLHGIIDVIASHRTRRTCSQIAAAGQHHRRTEVELGHAGSNNAHNALLPVLVVEHNAVVVFLAL